MDSDQRYIVIKGFKGKGGFRYKAGDLPSASVSSGWASVARLIRTDKVESYSGELPPSVDIVEGEVARVASPPMSIGRRIAKGLRARAARNRKLLREEVALAKAHLSAVECPLEKKEPEKEPHQKKEPEADASPKRKRGRPRKDSKNESQ